MIILSLDGAMNGCSVGVYCTEKQKCLASEVLEMSRGQAEYLIPMVSRALKQALLEYQDLNAIAVTHGPGAFTGIRIAMSAAKSLALSLDIPVVGVCTFDAILQTYIETDDFIESECYAVLLETKRDDFYVRYFKRKKGLLVAGADGCASLMSDIKQNISEKTIIIGDAVERYELGMPMCENGNIYYDIRMPLPDVIAKIGHKHLKECKTMGCFPVYLRSPDVGSKNK